MRGLFWLMLLVGQLSAVEVVVMRHGYAQHNRDGFHSGDPTHPNYRTSRLTEWGKLQVKMSASRLLARGINRETVDRVYVSPMPRTLETLQILADRGVVDPQRVEIAFEVTESYKGDLEGMSHSFAKLMLTRQARIEHHGVEPSEAIGKRMERFWKKIQPVRGRILIVTHGTPARLFIRRVAGESRSFGTADFHVCSVE